MNNGTWHMFMGTFFCGNRKQKLALIYGQKRVDNSIRIVA